MAWTSPMTAVDGNVFTAAQFNLNVRDNLNETAVAKATAAGGLIVTNGLNSVIQRNPTLAEYHASDETTTSTSYAALTTAGPSITITTGTKAHMFISARCRNNTASARNYVSVAVSGATTIAADDMWAIWTNNAGTSQHNRGTSQHLFTTLNAGSNTFTMMYKVSAGTGTFSNRVITIVPYS